MADSNQIKLGDVVRLKSGGPPMTAVGTDGYGPFVCSWFVPDEHNAWKTSRAIFDPAALELTDEKMQ